MRDKKILEIWSYISSSMYENWMYIRRQLCPRSWLLFQELEFLSHTYKTILQNPTELILETNVRHENWLPDYLVNNLETLLCSYSTKHIKSCPEIKAISQKKLGRKLYNSVRTNWGKSTPFISWPVYDFMRSQNYPKTYPIFIYHKDASSAVESMAQWYRELPSMSLESVVSITKK